MKRLVTLAVLALLLLTRPDGPATATHAPDLLRGGRSAAA